MPGIQVSYTQQHNVWLYIEQTTSPSVHLQNTNDKTNIHNINNNNRNENNNKPQVIYTLYRNLCNIDLLFLLINDFHCSAPHTNNNYNGNNNT